MSRSYRKYPLFSPSKKSDKELSSRILRHKVKEALNNWNENEDLVLLIPREIFDIWWNGSGDGSCQFDSEEYPELMRK